MVAIYAIISVFRPEAAVVLLLIISALKYSAFASVSFLQVVDLSFVIGGLCLVVVGGRVVTGTVPSSWIPKGGIICVVLMVVWLYLRQLGFPLDPAYAKDMYIGFILCAAAYTSPIILLKDPKASSRVLKLLIPPALLLAFALLLLGTYEVVPGVQQWGRLGMFATSGMYIANLIGAALLGMFGLIIIHRKARYWLLVLAFFPLAFAAIAATGTRGTFVWGLIFPLLYVPVVLGGKQALKFVIPVAVMGVAVYLVLPLIPQIGLDRLMTVTDSSSLDDRVTIWIQAAKDFFSHPLLGVGAGSFKVAAMPDIQYAHNLFLEAASTTGLLGLFFVAAPVVNGFFLSIRELFHRDTDPIQKRHVQAWLLLTIGLLADGMKSGGIGGLRPLFFVLGMLTVVSLQSRAQRMAASDVYWNQVEASRQLQPTGSV